MIISALCGWGDGVCTFLGDTAGDSDSPHGAQHSAPTRSFIDSVCEDNLYCKTYG